MQTSIPASILDTPNGREAEGILRKCVHCGFCNATCPTYQLLGNELDGPRGRIYLMKQVLEGHRPTHRTLTHLDRCLTCRACETTCPSGVEYGRPRRHRARTRGEADAAVLARGARAARDPERLRAPAPGSARPPRGPDRPAPPAARAPPHGAARPTGRPAPGGAPSPAHAGALGLRAARRRAPDQCRRRAGLRPPRRQPRAGRAGKAAAVRSTTT